MFFAIVLAPVITAMVLSYPWVMLWGCAGLVVLVILYVMYDSML